MEALAQKWIAMPAYCPVALALEGQGAACRGSGREDSISRCRGVGTLQVLMERLPYHPSHCLRALSLEDMIHAAYHMELDP